MNVETYISSGILELYVAGLLSKKENLEVHELAKQYPEINAEIVAIEAAILEFSIISGKSKAPLFSVLKQRISNAQKDTSVQHDNTKSNWSAYLGWAASVFFAIGLFLTYQQNKKLVTELELTQKENLQLEEKIGNSKISLEASKNLFNKIRNQNINVIELAGQSISPNSYAKVYWNKESQKVFVDAKGLPEPEAGMVYQVWSLKLNPLTPTNIGLLDELNLDTNKIFSLENPNNSEAFGITLEPSGGSDFPNLEQLYALGTVSNP